MNKMNRREFLNRLARTSLGATAYVSFAKMQLMNAAHAAAGDYRALVNIFLHGGNDSFNMIVPATTGNYQNYTAARQNLSVPQASLLTLDGTAANGAAYGIHPAMPEMQQLFNSGRASVLHNVGALVSPVTKDEYKNRTVLTPPRLFSHNDQQDFWKTVDDVKTTGWAGRIADILNTANINQSLSMNISLNGNNLWQSGRSSALYAISKNGVSKLSGLRFDGGTGSNSKRGSVFKAILDLPPDHLFVQEFANVQNRSISLADQLSTLLAGVPEPTVAFPDDNSLADQLKMVGKLISLRDTLQVSRQMFFVELGGWDTHSEQLAWHPGLLSKVSQAMAAFNTYLEELGVVNDVTSFTSSEFGRTLTSNGDGSDHGWGGNQIVMGGAVDGGKHFGTPPELIIDGPDDSGRGRIIPTTSVDQYAATLARWYGVSESDLNAIFPNLGNFTTSDLGFMV